MNKEKQATPEDAIEHARRYGRDFATDRIAKHMPEYAPADYWNWPENPGFNPNRFDSKLHKVVDRSKEMRR